MSESSDFAGIPMEDVRLAFLDREDIAPLPPDEQDRRWREHREKIEWFRLWLNGEDARGNAIRLEVEP